jgi:dipeptidyl aminopeptidase/acylaminoacyl peptidase
MTAPLGPSDLFDLKYLRGARLSPDGKRVAYALSRTDEAERFEVWVSDLTGKDPRRVPHSGNATAPCWSPDGSQIAFIGDQRLRVAAFPSLSVSAALTPELWAVRGTPAWSPDGNRLAVSLWKRKTVEGPRRITGTHFRADGIGFLDGVEQRIYAVDLCRGSSSPKVRCLTPSQGMCSEPQWSPCGRRLLLLATDAAIPFASYSPRLLCVEVDSGEVVEILGERWYIICARWLPSGDRIAVAAARDSTLTIPTVSLWVVDSIGGLAELRTQGAIGNVGFRIHHDMPAWDLTQDNTLTVIDRATAFATVQKGGSAEVWKIALEGPIGVERVLTGERSCIVLDGHRATDTLLFAVTDLRSPTELWTCDLNGYAQRRVTALNDEILAGWPRIEVERFVFPSADGMQIEAWFLAPAARTAALATILFIHGGPFGATGFGFRYDFLLLASQGFGVLFANFRGSAGYGEDFARAIMGDWGARGYSDHIGAVDAAIARGLADPERLGVWGPSHGGFATCWMVGHTSRFKAAVAEAAVTNFSTVYYLTDAPDGFRRDLGGRPDEIPDVYRARSPLTYAHRCTTPTMLLHGEEDLRCPIAEAEQFHRALRDVGCTTELFRIPGCSHLGDSMGPLSARRAQNEGLLSWFLRHL